MSENCEDLESTIHVVNVKIEFFLDFLVFLKDGLRVIFTIKCKSRCVNIIFGGTPLVTVLCTAGLSWVNIPFIVSSRGDFHIQMTGVLVVNFQNKPNKNQDLVLWTWLDIFFSPKGTNSYVTHPLSWSCFFGSAQSKAPAVDS